MEMDEELYSEGAKAIQKTADAASKAIEASEKAGVFLNRVFGDLVENAVGLVADQIQYYRTVQFFRLVDKASGNLKKRGVLATRPVPPKFALPLFESATREDDETLHNLWANLLSNAMDPQFRDKIRTAFVSILKDLSCTDALVLQVLSSGSVSQETAVVVAVQYRDLGNIVNAHPAEVAISLQNLVRLGCIHPLDYDENGAIKPRFVAPSVPLSSQFRVTELGVSFFRACMND
jgi:hypothetical protein